MSRTNEKGRSLKALIVLLVVLVAILAAVLVYFMQISSPLDSKSKDSYNIKVTEGSSTADIGTLLEENKVIKSAFSFRLFSKIKGYDGQYKTGTYALSPAMDMDEISKIIISGKSNAVDIAVPEGFTEYNIAKAVGESGVVSEKEFIAALEDGSYRDSYDFLKGAQKNKRYLEGYLFPDTYSIPVDADSDTIIRTMLDQYQQMYTDDFKARAKVLGFTDNEIIIIASLIEAESGVDQDRGKVASVIYNRLEEGMPLQIDATVQYALDLTSGRKESLTYDDTDIDSAYNTYKNDGLPPGPICCPGKKSIEAALNPEKTNYLYYVLSEKLDGSHNFSRDSEDFEKNKDAYYDALEKQESGN